MPTSNAVPETRAALPWYNYPTTRKDLDAIWRETRTRLIAAGVEGIAQLPLDLDHTTSYRELCSRSHLTLSQCCGLDLFQPHTDQVIPFAAPVITALAVPAGEYHSYIVGRSAAKLHEPRVVINDQFSHSGHTAIRIWLRAQAITRYTIFTSGSHAQSLAALRDGRADVAAIDALSWTHLETSGLSKLDTSDPAPAPPFVMGRESSVPVEALTSALGAALERHGQRIGISGLIRVSRADYAEIANAARGQGMLAPSAASPPSPEEERSK